MEFHVAFLVESKNVMCISELVTMENPDSLWLSSLFLYKWSCTHQYSSPSYITGNPLYTAAPCIPMVTIRFFCALGNSVSHSKVMVMSGPFLMASLMEFIYK